RYARFLREGYRLPKPLINIVGRPMIFWLLDNLKFRHEDTLWIGIQRGLCSDYAVEARLRKEYPFLDLRLVLLDFQTRGAAETLFIMLQQGMAPEELKRKTISLDCDTLYFSDVLGDFRDCQPECGCSFYFEDDGTKPIFSYIRFEPSTNKIVDIREKVAVSRYANTGAYAFPCGEMLRDACCGVLDNPVGKAGEFYTSTIIEKMIRNGKQFVGIHVSSFWCVGTPVQLRAFLDALRGGTVLPRHKARFCFDLDRTLLAVSTPRRGSGQDDRVEPLERNIRLLQSLRALGICFDEIYFDRPMADVYVNGRAGIDHGDVEREIGWRSEHSSDEDGYTLRKDNFVATRSFNKITSIGDRHIVKSGPFEFLRGELHFYKSVPPALSQFFPKLVEQNVEPGLESSSITITRIDGVSYSHLVTNHCVTRGRFLKLLCGLRAIHTTRDPSRKKNNEGTGTPVVRRRDSEEREGRRFAAFSVAPASDPVRRAISSERSPEDLHRSTLCANLHSKVSSRIQNHAMSYDGFEAVDIPAMVAAVLSYLQTYQEEGRFRQADFVHGDPVFSNCLLTKASQRDNVVFVDMRGLLGDLVCTTGDVHYDLSKVYQSLCGYDFIIMERDMDSAAANILCDLRENVFWPFVREHYPEALPRDIEVLAASHYLSILPLHEDRRHQAQFLSVCQDIL
ncbi:unnamed protein product, partial [Sphacelaria rigidula]